MLVNKKAPDFSLTTAPGDGSDNFKEVSLRDYLGSWTIMMFYPRDFTFV